MRMNRKRDAEQDRKRDQVLNAVVQRLLAAESELSLLREAADQASAQAAAREDLPLPVGQYL